MKKDKMQVQKRSSKMRNIFGGFNFNAFINSLSINLITFNKSVTDLITYSIVPTIKKNDGVIDNQLGIVVTKDFTYGDIYIEINRRYNCNPFSFSACKYVVNLDTDENRKKVKFFNLSEFGEDENFTIEFSQYKGIEKLNRVSSFEKYIYKMDADYKNNKGQVRKLLDILNKLAISNSGQITKSTDGTTYNIIVPFRDFIFATPSVPFKPVMIKSQKLHHVLTVDQTDNVFSFTVADEVRSEYSVNMIRPIEIFHDVSSTIPSRQWSGYILVTIDMNWNITMKFVTSDGWNPNNQWIYGRLWFASGNDKVESGANLSGESEYDVNFTNPNDNNRGYTDTVIRVHKLKAFRNRDDSQKIVIAEIKKISNINMKLFKDSNNNEPHYIKEGDDEIYVLRYQGRIEGYYDGERQTFPSMSIDISGDIKVKLPGRFKSGNGYKFITENYAGYKSPNPFGPFIENAFFGYNHINKSYYNLDGQNNNMLYLNENDVVYERDLNSGMWYVALKNKIQFTRKYFFTYSNEWDVVYNTFINLVLEIDENWKMSLVFYATFDNKDFNWIYAKLILETDVRENNFGSSNIIVGRTKNMTIHTNRSDDRGIRRGRYYSFRQCGNGATGRCYDNSKTVLTQLNTTVPYTIKGKRYNAALPVTNLNDFIRMDASIIVYNNAKIFSGPPLIDYIDRIGIREQKPYSTIYNPPITTTTSSFTVPEWNWNYSDGNILIPNAVVNISNALKSKRNEDGSFEVTILNDIDIDYTAIFPAEVSIEYDWQVTLHIHIDTKWNVSYTYTTPRLAWFLYKLPPNKHIQGEMRILSNEKGNNREVTLTKKLDGGRDYRDNIVKDLDNSTFIGWTDEWGLTANVKLPGNNSNTKTFTTLDNLIRFDANFGAYLFEYISNLEKMPYGGYLTDDKLIDNTIILSGLYSENSRI
jgi:hypothetical protein